MTSEGAAICYVIRSWMELVLIMDCRGVIQTNNASKIESKLKNGIRKRKRN